MEGTTDQGFAPRDPESDAGTQAHVSKLQHEFEQVYESARRAIKAGDTKTALTQCRAALHLLNETNLYGTKQSTVIRAIHDQVRELLNADD